MTEIKYPLAKETINKEEIDALIEWLKTYPRLTKGVETIKFEEEWAKFIGSKYSIMVNSGSSANLLMIYAIKHILNTNDRYKKLVEEKKINSKKIIVPSVGWGTTIMPAIQADYEVIMCGADSKTYGINLEQLEKECIKHKPAAVIFVQVLGVPHHREKLLALKKKYNFLLLEDACASLGAYYLDNKGSMDQMVGTIGDMSTFSFYFGHQLSTIEGGMININESIEDGESVSSMANIIRDTLLMLRSHGWQKDLNPGAKTYLLRSFGIDSFHDPFTFFIPGFNVRSTDLQAVIGQMQVKKAEKVCAERNWHHCRYAENLRGIVEFQDWGNTFPVSISFGALAPSAEIRKKIVDKLVANGVETRIFSAGNLGRHPFWIDYQFELSKKKNKKKYNKHKESSPKEKMDAFSFKDEVSDKIHECGFFLPVYPELTKEDIDFICSVVRSAL